MTAKKKGLGMVRNHTQAPDDLSFRCDLSRRIPEPLVPRAPVQNIAATVAQIDRLGPCYAPSSLWGPPQTMSGEIEVAGADAIPKDWDDMPIGSTSIGLFSARAEGGCRMNNPYPPFIGFTQFQSAPHTARGENYLYIIVIPRFTMIYHRVPDGHGVEK